MSSVIRRLEARLAESKLDDRAGALERGNEEVNRIKAHRQETRAQAAALEARADALAAAKREERRGFWFFPSVDELTGLGRTVQSLSLDSHRNQLALDRLEIELDASKIRQAEIFDGLRTDEKNVTDGLRAAQEIIDDKKSTIASTNR